MKKYSEVSFIILVFVIASCGGPDSEHKSADGHVHSENIESMDESGDVHHDALSVTKTQFELSNYKLSSLIERPFAEGIPLTGEIHRPEKSRIKVGSLIPGQVSPYRFIVGEWVKKGELLLSLTSPELVDLQEQFLVLKENQEYLKITIDRLTELTNSKITASKNLYQFENEQAVNEAKLKGIERKLELYGLSPDKVNLESMISSIPVYAPMSGYVTEITAIPGQYVQKGQSILEIANNNHLHLELSVLESDASRVQIGQEVSFRLESDLDKEYKADIYLIDPMLSHDGILKVHCHFDADVQRKLSPGMFVSAILHTSQKKVYSLPEEAFVRADGKDFLIAMEEERTDEYHFVPIQVQKGDTQFGYSEIRNLEDIREYQQFLTKGAFYVYGDSAGGHDH